MDVAQEARPNQTAVIPKLGLLDLSGLLAQEGMGPSSGQVRFRDPDWSYNESASRFKRAKKNNEKHSSMMLYGFSERFWRITLPVPAMFPFSGGTLS